MNFIGILMSLPQKHMDTMIPTSKTTLQTESNLLLVTLESSMFSKSLKI